MKKKIKPNTLSFCIPIANQSVSGVKKDILNAIELKPDFIEFRRDYFKESDEEVLALLKEAREQGIGVIYTYRNPSEGGKGDSSQFQRLKAIKTAIESGVCDYIDIEKVSNPAYTSELTDAAIKEEVGVIRSHHNFEETPGVRGILEQLNKSTLLSDVVKAAYMCEDEEDIISLITAGRLYKDAHPNKPLILIGMGAKGAITRILPELLESNLTYCAGARASAPGQMPFNQVLESRKVLGFK